MKNNNKNLIMFGLIGLMILILGGYLVYDKIFVDKINEVDNNKDNTLVNVQSFSFEKLSDYQNISSNELSCGSNLKIVEVNIEDINLGYSCSNHNTTLKINNKETKLGEGIINHIIMFYDMIAIEYVALNTPSILIYDINGNEVVTYDEISTMNEFSNNYIKFNSSYALESFNGVAASTMVVDSIQKYCSSDYNLVSLNYSVIFNNKIELELLNKECISSNNR